MWNFANARPLNHRDDPGEGVELQNYGDSSLDFLVFLLVIATAYLNIFFLKLMVFAKNFTKNQQVRLSFTLMIILGPYPFLVVIA